jgi:putative ATPase
MRPKRLEDVVGQTHLLGDGHILARAIRADRIPSMILWGPPGTGKTTLAHVIANETNALFVPFSAVLGGVPELRKIIAGAKEQKSYYGKKSILFVDEIHRFNKAQQDALLPHVENGTVTLIGATTENPSFAVNSALLSRARVFDLRPLDSDDLRLLLERALADTERGLGHVPHSVDDEYYPVSGESALIWELVEKCIHRRSGILQADLVGVRIGIPDEVALPWSLFRIEHDFYRI